MSLYHNYMCIKKFTCKIKMVLLPLNQINYIFQKFHTIKQFRTFQSTLDECT